MTSWPRTPSPPSCTTTGNCWRSTSPRPRWRPSSAWSARTESPGRHGGRERGKERGGHFVYSSHFAVVWVCAGFSTICRTFVCPTTSPSPSLRSSSASVYWNPKTRTSSSRPSKEGGRGGGMSLESLWLYYFCGVETEMTDQRISMVTQTVVWMVFFNV